LRSFERWRFAGDLTKSYPELFLSLRLFNYNPRGSMKIAIFEQRLGSYEISLLWWAGWVTSIAPKMAI